MNHPPIPMNSDIVCDESCDDLYIDVLPFKHASKHVRIYNPRFIAAVARCAWMDKAQSTKHRDDPEGTWVSIALLNAELWRVWGLQ